MGETLHTEAISTRFRLYVFVLSASWRNTVIVRASPCVQEQIPWTTPLLINITAVKTCLKLSRDAAIASAVIAVSQLSPIVTTVAVIAYAALAAVFVHNLFSNDMPHARVLFGSCVRHHVVSWCNSNWRCLESHRESDGFKVYSDSERTYFLQTSWRYPNLMYQAHQMKNGGMISSYKKSVNPWNKRTLSQSF